MILALDFPFETSILLLSTVPVSGIDTLSIVVEPRNRETGETVEVVSKTTEVLCVNPT